MLLATAFIHLLPTAFISMTDPCLPDFWNKTYPQMAGLVAMAAVFMVVMIEMFFATRGAGHSHATDWEMIPEERPPSRTPSSHGSETFAAGTHANGNIGLHRLEAAGDPYSDDNDATTPKAHESDSHESDEDLDDLEALDPIAGESLSLRTPFAHRAHGHDHYSASVSSEVNPQRLLLQCLLLEAGILFHSIFIGMAVSVATGTEFVVLLVAICFHQAFEGLALGARIAALIPNLFDARSPKPWLMALAYGTTTPIGQAIGIWMHSLYDPASEVGLLMVGITNAISSGLLLFAGLVQLIAEDFLSEKSYQVLKGRRRIEACLAVCLGGLLMAIVGAFA